MVLLIAEKAEGRFDDNPSFSRLYVTGFVYVLAGTGQFRNLFLSFFYAFGFYIFCFLFLCFFLFFRIFSSCFFYVFFGFCFFFFFFWWLLFFF